MRELKREVSFLDADGKRAKIEAEITTRNGYFEFTASGTYLNCGGQCLDQIKPLGTWQKQLIQLWEEYHLKNVSEVAGFDDKLDFTLNNIEAQEKERAEKAEKEASGKTDDELLLEEMSEYGINEDNLDACRAYKEVMSADDLSNFEESYSGKFDDDEDFAREQAESLGAIDREAHWPMNCIDWEQAARELMMDYYEQDGYYFTAI